MKKVPLILAVDTSCDDTAAAVTRGTRILSNVIASQTELHKPYGGVFPTVAKQAHKENIYKTIKVALKRAKVSMADINLLAVTTGPGLAPALEIGIAHMKKLSIENNLPLIPVNHIHGHAFSSQAVPKTKSSKINIFDNKRVKSILAVIVSGGHTEFIRISSDGEFKILGKTLDDAAGECLDKIGRMLNLGYPAGPIIEEMARNGNPKYYEFPLPLTHIKNYDLSFSGLKTHTRNLIKTLGGIETLSKDEISNFAASAQHAVFRHISYKLNYLLQNESFDQIWLGGGVASNTTLRRMIRETIKANRKAISDPKLAVPYTQKLCMDNAAMIGVAAHLSEFSKAVKPKFVNKIERRPRWRADEN